jgi:hypothetical protein
MKYSMLRRVYRRLPGSWRPFAEKLYYRGRHWAHPALKKFGTVQDLYYWVEDGKLDTLLLLQNYFSALYPALDTETDGTVTLFSKDGEALGTSPFSVGHLGCARFRVSSLLKGLHLPDEHTYGTLEVHIAIPKAVLSHIRSQRSLYFWDRFYIGYMTRQGQTCFVHGVDKTHIYRDGQSEPIDWYETPKDYQWAPETPVNIDDYEKFSVVMVNRTARRTSVTLTLADTKDESLSWSQDIPSKGVRRFELTAEDTSGLAPVELRMRIKGMPTQYGRPVVFKEFRNGAISAMHC